MPVRFAASSNSTRHRWLWLAAIGCALVVLAMITSALVIWDKPHFGWMVGTAFLGIITSGCLVGGLLVLVGTLKLPERWTWRGIVLLVWALIALTSPAFGFLFLLPWGVLALMLPLIVPIFVTLFRTA
jgi:Ca2+/Na+ antiporter